MTSPKLELPVDPVGVHLPEPRAPGFGAALLDPVLMVGEDLDEVAHRGSPGDQAEDLGVSLEDGGALDGLAGDALVLGEHDEPMAAGVIDPGLVLGLLRARGAVDVDEGDRSPNRTRGRS